jgi:hypothetical protein
MGGLFRFVKVLLIELSMAAIAFFIVTRLLCLAEREYACIFSL